MFIQRDSSPMILIGNLFPNFTRHHLITHTNEIFGHKKYSEAFRGVFSLYAKKLIVKSRSRSGSCSRLRI